jgi:glycosyltransferase involved in cell wall biosynthesis
MIDSLAIGGAERMLVEIANQTDRSRFEVSVCITRQDAALASDLHPGIALHRLDRSHRFDVQGFKRFRALQRTAPADLIHVHGLSSFSFLLFARMLGLPLPKILLHDHNGWIETELPVPAWFRLFGPRALDAYVGVHTDLEHWAHRAGIPESKAQTIENGLDLAGLRGHGEALCRADLGVGTKGPLGVLVGGIRRQKGLDLLIEAVAQMDDPGPFTILVIGQVQEQAFNQTCRRRIAELGLDARFIFLGPRRDVPAVLKAVDFAVMASRSESGPLVLIEYMALGLPFVAFQVGAISHQAANVGIPGFVPMAEISYLAAALDQLLRMDPVGRQARGELGQETAQGHFEIRTKIPAWQDLYTRLLEEPAVL